MQACDIYPVNKYSLSETPITHIVPILPLSTCLLMWSFRFFLPALSLFPGLIPAHDDRCDALGNLLISAPVSAIIIVAPILSTPGIVSSNSTSSSSLRSLISPSISFSSFAFISSIYSMCFKLISINIRWCSVIRLLNDFFSSSILLLNLPLANSLKLSRSLLPRIISLIILRPETPRVSVATDDSFMFASSKYFCSLFFSDAILLLSLLLYLVKSLNCLMCLGGIQLPCIKPFLNNLHNHSLSATSVFRPGTFFICLAFARITSTSFSKLLYTGLQYIPVLSMATCVTPSLFSQSRNSSIPSVIVEYARISFFVIFPSLHIMMHAVNVFLCT